MKIFINSLWILPLTLALALPAAAKKGEQGFPGKSGGAIHSNAPNTGTQMRGKDRALEVGKGKKKGLYREDKLPQRRKGEKSQKREGFGTRSR